MPTTELELPPPLLRKLEQMREKLRSLQASLNDPEFLAQPQRMIAASKESGQLSPAVERYEVFLKASENVAELKALAESDDPEMAHMAAAELPEARRNAEALLEQIKEDLIAAEELPVDSFFLEIRAGTGGEEAALFARDLFEMYRRYCQARGFKFEVNDFSTTDRGGFKEVIVNIRGNTPYRRLRFEGGGHRVQRVPETEAQGRIHTSAATVAVLPELPDVKIEINPKDIEEFGCRGGGPGGQNVNKVETGWRILHKPSGLQFKMTEHKSQTQNKERAWALLRATLYEAEQAKQTAAAESKRKSMIGSGDRSQRIRTYNFPQNRCTDHRLGGEEGGEKNFALDQIMLGFLDPLLDALLELDKRQRLESL